MDLRGKSREQIERALAGKGRAELLDIVVSMAAVEQHFKPAEIAARSAMKKRTILVIFTPENSAVNIISAPRIRSPSPPAA